MLRCKQVSTIVAGGNLSDAGLWVRLRVRLHIMMCRHCARYAAQLRAIGAKARERFHVPEERSNFDDLQKRILESANKSRKSES